MEETAVQYVTFKVEVCVNRGPLLDPADKSEAAAVIRDAAEEALHDALGDRLSVNVYSLSGV